MDEVLDIFREEAREHLGALEKSFLDLETVEGVDARRALIDDLFRRAHSLKGDAKVVGLNDLKAEAQQLEDLLDQLRDDPENVNRETIDAGLAQFDKVRAAFEQWQTGSPPDSPADTSSSPPPSPAQPTVQTEPEAETTPPPTKAAEQSDEPSQIKNQKSKIDESFTVRVPSERLDRMLNLAGEVRISQRSGDALADRLGGLRDQLEGLKADPTPQVENQKSKIENLLDQVRRIEGDLRNWRGREELLVESLQNDIRQARLLPLVMLADTLRRAVRDLAQSLGKSIRYEADVGNILLDKAVIEALKDPLSHMIRNAADHGIEAAAERRAAGKPEEGTIRVAASRAGQLVRITISDDGRGVDYARIRDKIHARGDLDAAEVAAMSERALGQYLFKAGFSTAPTGEVSGRGVGLDVVLDAVRRLQGSVELLPDASLQSPAEDEPNPKSQIASRNWSTTFAITVPVSISTVRILTVTCGGQYYGIPCAGVVRTGRATQDELRELEGSFVLPVNGEPVRWIHLADLLGTQLPVAERRRAWSYLLVTTGGGAKKTAVAVDDLEEESEALLKPLGFPLNGMSGIVGATIRADGSVQLVLDLSSAQLTGSTGAAAARSIREPKIVGRILVVDDSPTTRAVLRKVFAASGYAVATASDGVDALERLRLQNVDLVVSDVEMPRLNGFDLVRHIKQKWGLPVILVTGREKEEHRREGLEAGADAYVVKSTFEDKSLLEIVEQFF